jgi:hypothetical protein
MKYALSLVSIVFLMSAIACNKSDDDNGGNQGTTPGKTWKLGSTTYTVNNYTKTSGEFQVYDVPGNGMIFSFRDFPTTDGSYNVVSNTATLGPNDVSVVAFSPVSGTSYFSTGRDSTVASVKVMSASRLAITLPDTWVVKGGTDSLKLSANIGAL